MLPPHQKFNTTSLAPGLDDPAPMGLQQGLQHGALQDQQFNIDFDRPLTNLKLLLASHPGTTRERL